LLHCPSLSTSPPPQPLSSPPSSSKKQFFWQRQPPNFQSVILARPREHFRGFLTIFGVDELDICTRPLFGCPGIKVFFSVPQFLAATPVHPISYLISTTKHSAIKLQCLTIRLLTSFLTNFPGCGDILFSARRIEGDCTLLDTTQNSNKGK